MGGYSLVATQSITLPMSNIPISITLSELSLHKGTPLARAIPPYCDIYLQALTQIRDFAWRVFVTDRQREHLHRASAYPVSLTNHFSLTMLPDINASTPHVSPRCMRSLLTKINESA